MLRPLTYPIRTSLSSGMNSPKGLATNRVPALFANTRRQRNDPIVWGRNRLQAASQARQSGLK